MKLGDEYTCAMCKETFTTTWEDAEAEAEYQRNFTEEEKATPREIVCDDCWSKLVGCE